MPVRGETASSAFRRASAPQYLAEIFERHVEKGNVRGRDGVSVDHVRQHLRSTVESISTRCRNGTYQFTTYRERLILKGAGKAPRVISIPTVRDRIALRMLADVLSAAFPTACGQIPQAAVAAVAVALQTEGYDSFVRIDVEHFFPSVDHEILANQLRRKVRKPEILDAIAGAIRTRTAADRAPRPRGRLACGVPQGLSISNPLAEIYIQPLDLAMSKVPGISYHRFVDDILILCDAADAEAIDRTCRSELAELKLSAHARTPGGKSQIGRIDSGFDYLGYTFSGAGIGVRPGSVTQLEGHLARIHSTWRRENSADRSSEAQRRFTWHRNLAITGCVYQGTAYGWLQYFRQLDDLRVLKRLDATVQRLANRYAVPGPPPKTYMRAYWAIRHPRARNQAYIPNFDLYNPAQMRAELLAMGTNASAMSDREVETAFYSTVSKAVRDLERDVGSLS